MQRNNYELKNAALERSLISIEDMTDAWGAIVRTVKGMILSLPARYQEKLPHLPFDDVETIHAVTHKVLLEVSRMMPEDPPIPDRPGPR